MFIPSVADAGAVDYDFTSCPTQRSNNAELQSDVTVECSAKVFFTFPHGDFPHAEPAHGNGQHVLGWECTHIARARSQPVQFDRGPNGHLHQTDDVDL